jgi:hypothetical protein
MGLPGAFFLPKNKKDYFLVVILLSGFFISLTFLLPQMRQFICIIIEQLVLHRKLQNPEKWEYKLFEYALVGSGIMLTLNFLLLTQPGRKLINKTESEGKTKNEFFNISMLKNIFYSERFFARFATFTGIIVFIITFFRAANTSITWDEVTTYQLYVLPNIFDSFTKNQYLNNHFLNSLCIRVVMFFSQSKYNELLIRFPNIFFYCIYIYFSFVIARQYRNKFFVFILFISNYYLNEFFGLARGYGMACACMTGVCYYFEKWKSVYINKENDRIPLLLFLFFCTLATLSNPITLYIIFCFFILINFKYKKDIFTLPNMFIFIISFLTVFHSVLSSNRGGESIYSAHNIYYTVMSIPGMFTDSTYLAFLITLVFFLSFGWVIIKTKAKDDYCWVLIIFIIDCVVSQIVFQRGYPVMREMIPFYPVFVVIIANAQSYISNYRITKPILAVCAVLLLLQFSLKINTGSTKDWNDNYPIRDVVYSYIGSHDVLNNKEEFLFFIRMCQDIRTSQGQSSGEPVFMFYAEKAEYLLKNNTGENQ